MLGLSKFKGTLRSISPLIVFGVTSQGVSSSHLLQSKVLKVPLSKDVTSKTFKIQGPSPTFHSPLESLFISSLLYLPYLSVRQRLISLLKGNQGYHYYLNARPSTIG